MKGIRLITARAAAVIILTAYATVLPSCSFVFYDTVKDNLHPSVEVKCQGHTCPVVDLGISLGFGAVTGLLVERYFNYHCTGFCIFPNEFMLVMAIIHAIPAIVFGSSSIAGFVWESDCRRAKEKHQQWLEAARIWENTVKTVPKQEELDLIEEIIQSAKNAAEKESDGR
jgi:hypothetical protein